MCPLLGLSGFGQPTIEWLPPGGKVAPATPAKLKEPVDLRRVASLELMSPALTTPDTGAQSLMSFQGVICKACLGAAKCVPKDNV